MQSFDLSLIARKGPASEVQASAKYDMVENPKTDEKEKQTITDGGITIAKDSPILKLDGPMGYKYTQLLNQELSLESMGAIVAAAEQSGATDMETVVPGSFSGKVTVNANGAGIDHDGTAGYIYITSADNLESKDVGSIAKNLLDKRLQDPKRQLGLAMVTEGKPSAVMESLYQIAVGAGIQVTTTDSGLKSMMRSMLEAK